jgi:hypothetical protein
MFDVVFGQILAMYHSSQVCCESSFKPLIMVLTLILEVIVVTGIFYM